jgi:DNA-binding MarR family transcriptional regulator
MARLYTRSDAGRKAWDTQNSLVALDCRRVLGLVGQDTDPRDLRARLGWSESALNDILEELEQGGLVTWVDTAPSESELDFTGSFNVDDLRAARENK